MKITIIILFLFAAFKAQAANFGFGLYKYTSYDNQTKPITIKDNQIAEMQANIKSLNVKGNRLNQLKLSCLGEILQIKANYKQNQIDHKVQYRFKEKNDQLVIQSIKSAPDSRVERSYKIGNSLNTLDTDEIDNELQNAAKTYKTLNKCCTLKDSQTCLYTVNATTRSRELEANKKNWDRLPASSSE